MARKKVVSKSRMTRWIDTAIGFGLGTVVVVPVLFWLKSKAGV